MLLLSFRLGNSETRIRQELSKPRAINRPARVSGLGVWLAIQSPEKIVPRVQYVHLARNSVGIEHLVGKPESLDGAG